MRNFHKKIDLECEMLTIEAQSVSKISGGSVQNVAGEHVNVLLKSMSFNQ